MLVKHNVLPLHGLNQWPVIPSTLFESPAQRLDVIIVELHVQDIVAFGAGAVFFQRLGVAAPQETARQR